MANAVQCDACGCDLTGIFSKHYFGDWGLNPHCLPCGRKCDDEGLREPHAHQVAV
jgi:hypothetical protein